MNEYLNKLRKLLEKNHYEDVDNTMEYYEELFADKREAGESGRSNRVSDKKMRAFYRICSAWYYGESLFVDVLSNGDAFEQKEKSKRYTTDRGKITKNCKAESCSTGECTAGNKKYRRESYGTGISNTGNRNFQTDSRKH